MAKRLLRRAARRLPIAVEYPDGSRVGSGGDVPVLRLHEPTNLSPRLSMDGTIGFGEAYLVGDWSTDSLVDLLIPLAANVDSLIPKPLRAFRRFAAPRKPDRENNTVAGARQNIERHYDLSNEMFAVFLDDTMTYSSAFFESDTEDLGAAQVRKIDAILDYAGVGAGTGLLEIGTGWGALSVRAARRGARVTSLTISPRQKELAEQRAREAGVADRVEVVLRDYRHETGSYDAVASVEMIEAVGHQHWRDYFAMVDRVLSRAGGSRCRPSPCRTSRCWPPPARRAGRTSTFSPAANCCRFPRSRNRRRYPAAHHRTARARCVLRAHVAAVAGAVLQPVVGGCRARVRRDLSANVAVLPGLFRGGSPGRLSERLAVPDGQIMIQFPGNPNQRAVQPL